MKMENNFAFIDGQNLNLGIKSLGWKLDYSRFRKYLSEKYSVSTAYYFVGYVAGNQPLYSELQKAGYILVFKPTIPDGDGKIKGNIDADLVLQAMVDFANYDKAIIAFESAGSLPLGELKIKYANFSKKSCLTL